MPRSVRLFLARSTNVAVYRTVSIGSPTLECNVGFTNSGTSDVSR